MSNQATRRMIEWQKPPAAGAVNEAGAMLSRRIPADDHECAVDAFRVAHEWRAAHVPPMASMRLGLRSISRAICPDVTVAGRIKTMRSIRRKLRRSGITLWEMQDVAGIRAIVSTPDEVDSVARRYLDGGTRHRVAREQDYIRSPKATGYRSRHLMMRFAGDGDTAAWSKRAVEIQIRTQLQHSWATAIEAVGLMRGEDLKGGLGNPEWLELFALMSAQFADDEGLAAVPGQPTDRAERMRQILVLENHLNAMAELDGYKHAVHRLQDRGRAAGGRFVVTFDRANKRVQVAEASSLEAFMTSARASDLGEVQSVVVEVDHVDALVAAYPNYFADVTMFATRLRAYLTGRDGVRRHPFAWLRDWQWRKA